LQRLYVLYDDRCGLCRWARRWVEGQAKFVAVDFVSAWSDKARRMFPGLRLEEPVEELVAVSDEGAVYRGGSAWVMVLYCLSDYREWSLRLASPALLPLARRAFDLLSKHRGVISHILHPDDEDGRIVAALREAGPGGCDLSPGPAAPALRNDTSGADGSESVPGPSAPV
jgi:predicted DCC family thiol-disulfide oxidoreductase YuxK